MRAIISVLALLFAAPTLASEAEDLMRAGRIAEALPVARAAAEENTGDIDAQELYIDALLTMRLLGIADQTYRARVEAVPTADSWYLFARVLINPDEAERAYRMALQQDEEHARSYMGLGAIYRATGRPTEALAEYERALSFDATLAEAYAGLVQIHLGLSDTAAAKAIAERAKAAIPNDPEGYLILAQLEPETALATLVDGANQAPGDPRIHAALSERWLDAGNGEEARASARRALAISPSFADPALSLMFADEMAREVLDADGYHDLLSTRIIEETEPFAARRKYDELVERYPQSALPYMSRARVRARAGETTEAIDDLARAITNDAGNLDAQAALGLLLLEADRLSEAQSVLSQVVEARAGDATLALALARAQDEAGERDAAAESVATIREARPLHVEAALMQAKFQAEAGDSEAAYETLITLAREVPDERLVLALAAASKDIGRTADAATWLDQLARSSGNPRYSELADALRRAP